MTGLYLLFVSAIWLVGSFWISKVATSHLTSKWVRTASHLLVFLTFLLFPLLDEIFGRLEFKELCLEHSTTHVSKDISSGQAVYLADLPDIHLKNTWVPIRLQRWVFLDVGTNQPVVRYNELYPSGGRFIRTLGITQDSKPLTFNSSCVPGAVVDPVQLLKNLKLTQVQRDDLPTRNLKIP